MRPLPININDRFGRLVVRSVIKRAGKDNKVRSYCECVCDCGKTTIVRADTLRTATSCGCISIEKLKEMSTKHHKSHTRLYGIWTAMKARCYNNNTINYRDYGGRGIFVCKEWKDDFSVFYDWAINNGYKSSLTIDRIDVNGNYCPDNCRWISMKKQQNNRTNNRIISFNGEQHTMTEWGEITGIKEYNIYNRLQDGWSVEDALTKPVIKYRKRVWNKTGNGTYHHENGIED